MLALLACVDSDILKLRTETTPTSKALESSDWQPGDDIPGWEPYNFDCPLEENASSAIVSFPDLWRGRFGLAQLEDGLWMEWGFTLADCTDFACEGISSQPLNAPAVWGEFSDWEAADLWTKTGPYGPRSDRPESNADASFQVPTGGFTSTDDDGSHLVRGCLSRARPDVVSGVIYVSYSSSNLYHGYYNPVTVQYPFDIRFEDHAAWNYTRAAAARAAAPDDRTAPYFAYGDGASYDIAWDWDAITDPDIRTAVYDRYTPENWP